MEEDFAPGGEMTSLSDLGLDMSGPPASGGSKDQLGGSGAGKKVTFNEDVDVKFIEDDDEVYEDDRRRRRSDGTGGGGYSVLSKPLWVFEVVDGISLLAGVLAAWYSGKIPVVGAYVSELHFATRIVIFAVIFRVIFLVISYLLARMGTGDKRRRRRR